MTLKVGHAWIQGR